MSKAPRPFLGLIAGVTAGLVASVAMAAFQAQGAKLLPAEGDEDPATVKAADKVSEAVIGDPVPEPYRERAGQGDPLCHRRSARGHLWRADRVSEGSERGFRQRLGVVTSALLDEAAVPALDLGPTPTETPLSTHAYGAASHLVYGWVLEGVRALIAGRR